MPILTDLSTAKLNRALQSNHREFDIVNARVAGARVERRRGLTWILKGRIDIPFPRLKASEADDALAVELRRMRRLSKARHINCQLGPVCTPADLWARLVGHGFTLPAHSLAGMACSLGAMRKRRCGPRDLRIEPMTDADLFAEHRHPFMSDFADVDTAVKASRLRPQRLWNLLAWLDGKPVGSASLFLAAGVAGIYDVGVLSDYRRRGIGADVTAAACRLAKTMGYEAAVLTASPNGESPYRRVGFREVCRVEACELSVEAQRHRPLTPRQRQIFLTASVRISPKGTRQ